jgi:hypothetical protein
MPIFVQTNSTNSIDLSGAPNSDICIHLLHSLNGSSFSFEDYDPKLLIQTFLYLRISVKKFVFLLISNDLIEMTLSSTLLFLPNEQFLFNFILNKIKENQMNLSLIKYLFFGNCNRSSLTDFIVSVQLNEIISFVFDYIKTIFFFKLCGKF